MSKETMNTIKRLIVVLGIIIIPLLYSYLYLGAFWDPYSRLDTLPVAVVNADEGAQIHDVNRNLGEELISSLKEDGSLKFVVTTQADAQAGTEGSEYYATLTIPSDFSKNIASAETAEKTAATLSFTSNEKKNYLSSQIMKTAVLRIEEKLRGEVDAEMVQSLSDKLAEVPDSMAVLSDGFTTLQNGSIDLVSGTKDLSAGAANLLSGAKKVDSGSRDLSAGAENLVTGSGALAAGAADLASGARNLTSGTQLFAANMNTFDTSMGDAAAGSFKLSTGAASLDTGIDTLLTGVQQLSESTEDIGTITAGAAKLAESTNTFNNSLTAYISGVDTLIAGVNSTSGFLKNYVVNINPAIMQDPYFAAFMASMSDPSLNSNITALTAANVQMKAASSQIAAGTAALASGTESLPQIKEALSQLESGLLQAQTGSASLSSGAADLNAGLVQLDTASGKLNEASQTILSGSQVLSDGATALSGGASTLTEGASALSSGAAVLSDGTSTLSQGASDLVDGTSALSDGAAVLSEGIGTAKTGIDDSILNANANLGVLNGLSGYANAPVTVDIQAVNPVQNYGTAFAPYFLSLSLWVGGVMIFLGTYLDGEGRFKVLSRNSTRKVLRSFIFMGLGLVQAVVLGVALKYCLGLTVKNEGLYFFACALYSLCAVAVIQFFMVNFRDIGKFICIALLILQLTACGGTFPMETVPKFFNVIYPYMPMTYSVGLFKEAISGGDRTLVFRNAVILAVIAFAFTSLTIIMTVVTRRRAKRTAVILQKQLTPRFITRLKRN